MPDRALKRNKGGDYTSDAAAKVESSRHETNRRTPGQNPAHLSAAPKKACCRQASYKTTDTVFDRFKLRLSGRIGR